MSGMGRFRIKQRILLALLVPTLGFLVAASAYVVRERGVALEMRRLGTLVDFAQHVSDLVHEAQKERGGTTIFLSSKGQQFQRELADQRRLTDERRADFVRAIDALDHAFLDQDFIRLLDDAKTRLAEIEPKRDAISALQLPAAESTAYYTGTIRALLDINVAITKRTTEPSIAAPLAAYVNLTEAKERAGLERATLAQGLTLGSFDLALHNRLDAISAE